MVGARVAELGAGLAISPCDMDAARLQRAMQTVLSHPAFRDRALALGTSLRASGGYRRAVDAILAFARSRA